MININLRSIILRSARLIVMTCICALLLFSNMMPSMAASSSRSYDGEVSLDEIQNRTDEIAKSDPRSMEELQSDLEGGLNAVQGKGDYGKMKRPSNSKDATTIKEQIEEGLKNITPGRN